MSQAGQTARGRGTKPETGQILDVQHRTVQSPGSGEQRDINLTDFGRRLHGFDPGDSLSVAVCENGVWITNDE